MEVLIAIIIYVSLLVFFVIAIKELIRVNSKNYKKENTKKYKQTTIIYPNKFHKPKLQSKPKNYDAESYVDACWEEIK